MITGRLHFTASPPGKYPRCWEDSESLELAYRYACALGPAENAISNETSLLRIATLSVSMYNIYADFLNVLAGLVLPIPILRTKRSHLDNVMRCLEVTQSLFKGNWNFGRSRAKDEEELACSRDRLRPMEHVRKTWPGAASKMLKPCGLFRKHPHQSTAIVVKCLHSASSKRDAATQAQLQTASSAGHVSCTGCLCFHDT